MANKIGLGPMFVFLAFMDGSGYLFRDIKVFSRGTSHDNQQVITVCGG